jgi:hypothetical protein
MRKFLFVTFLFVTFLNCSNDNKCVYGYIPVDQKAEYVWHQTPTLKYIVDPRVMVITKDDTLMVSFGKEGFFGGSEFVLYKDTYPPAIGRKIYVRFTKRDNDVYYIIDVSPDPFSEN